MNFPDAVISCFTKYVTFTGRAPRSEYWFWILFTIAASFVLGLVDGAMMGAAVSKGGLLGTLFSLATLLPGISVGVRRMHDTDRSGWWLFINLIPLIGWVLFIIWAATKGTSGPNRFGPDPL